MKFHVGFSGHFRLETHDAQTGELRQVREFDNIITNSGLNSYGAGVRNMQWCHVGTGQNTPAATDSALGNPIAATNTILEKSNPAAEAPDWILTKIIAYRFAAGAAAGNISEVGIASAGLPFPSNAYLWSRARILDEHGNPSTITVLNNEYLDVYYTVKIHLPIGGEITFPVTISGNNHTVKAKIANVSTALISTSANGIATEGIHCRQVKTNSTELGGIDGEVNGTGYGVTGNSVLQAYQNNSFKTSSVITFALNQANYPNGISGLVMRTNPTSSASQLAPFFQAQYLITPPIMKTQNNELALTFEYSWGRYGE